MIMKRVTTRLGIFLLHSIFVSIFNTAFSQPGTIFIQSNASNGQVSFATSEIKKAAEETGFTVIVSRSVKENSNQGLSVRLITDSTSVVNIVRANDLEKPKYFGWQCYSIRIKTDGKRKVIFILSGDNAGAMYGGLDVAEAIRLGTLDRLTGSDHKPYLERRGIKFNIPLDLRTPSYSDMGDAAQQNIPVGWDMDFWKQQFDEMARHRYNVISLWSENPFPSLVKIPEFPEIALKDVYRTKTKIRDDYNLSGLGLFTSDMLEEFEIVKKITIDEKISFWKKVMEYAHSRGIEVYWFTWNIFTYGIEGKYGIDDRQENDTTIAYYRSAVREMVLTYPDLDGFGITAGENMERKKTKYSKYSNEQWLWKTYGEGISDALKKQPERKIRLIHRFHQTNLTEIMDAFKEFQGTFDMSYKYSIAHMYSVPDPIYIKSSMPLFSPELKTWLTVRNDDIYSFRWGNPSFARKYILSIPEPQKIAGFYMGPDGYTWGRDFLSKDNSIPRPLIIQKQWYSFMLWGRLSFDPTLSDELFLNTIDSRLKAKSSDILMSGWSAASMIFPWITRFSWGDVDFKWFPEACISRKSFKGFYTVQDFMQVEPQPGSNISNIIRWAQYYKLGRPDSLISPLAVADTLSRYARLALLSLKSFPDRDINASDELNQTLGDIEAFATIGNYYAEKIRGACSLALYNFYGIKMDQDEAVYHLDYAKTLWTDYAEIYSTKYKPALFSRIGYVNIPDLIEKTENDISIARNWVPGSIIEYKQGKIIYP